ncbi:MAG TPA: hypothetical protein VIO60_03030, partial [Rectinemataceae bacterium]
MDKGDPRSALPQVGSLLEHPRLLPSIRTLSPPLASRIVAKALADLRARLGPGTDPAVVPERAL